MESSVTPSFLALLMAPREGGNATMVFIIQMVAIFAIFYFLLIRPQRMEQKRHQEMVDSLRKGQEIITVGGIIATVVHADPDRLTVKTADSTRLVVDRSKVARVLDSTGETDTR